MSAKRKAGDDGDSDGAPNQKKAHAVAAASSAAAAAAPAGGGGGWVSPLLSELQRVLTENGASIGVAELIALVYEYARPVPIRFCAPPQSASVKSDAIPSDPVDAGHHKAKRRYPLRRIYEIFDWSEADTGATITVTRSGLKEWDHNGWAHTNRAFQLFHLRDDPPPIAGSRTDYDLDRTYTWREAPHVDRTQTITKFPVPALTAYIDPPKLAAPPPPPPPPPAAAAKKSGGAAGAASLVVEGKRSRKPSAKAMPRAAEPEPDTKSELKLDSEPALVATPFRALHPSGVVVGFRVRINALASDGTVGVGVVPKGMAVSMGSEAVRCHAFGSGLDGGGCACFYSNGKHIESGRSAHPRAQDADDARDGPTHVARAGDVMEVRVCLTTNRVWFMLNSVPLATLRVYVPGSGAAGEDGMKFGFAVFASETGTSVTILDL